MGRSSTIELTSMIVNKNHVKNGQVFKVAKNGSGGSPSIVFNDVDFSYNIGGKQTSILSPTNYYELEVYFQKCNFVDNFGPITNDIYAAKIKSLTITGSNWKETRNPDKSNPRLLSSAFKNYKAKFMVMDTSSYNVKISETTFDCGNSIGDKYELFQEELGRSGENSLFKFEVES